MEDDGPLARAISRVLVGKGHSVETVPSCGAARQKLGCFDLGVFDIDLPDGTGIDLARELIAKNAVLLTVFFSATGDIDLQEQARELGTFVHKSAGVAELSEAVAETVDSSIEAAIAAGAEGFDPSSSQRHKKGEDSQVRKKSR